MEPNIFDARDKVQTEFPGMKVDVNISLYDGKERAYWNGKVYTTDLCCAECGAPKQNVLAYCTQEYSFDAFLAELKRQVPKEAVNG